MTKDKQLDSEIKLEQFVLQLREAHELSMEKQQMVYMTDDEGNNWHTGMCDQEGFYGAILLEIHPDGSVRMIDNTHAGNSEEPWRR